MAERATTVADIDAAWLDEHCDLGGVVADVRAEPIGEGVGMIATLARLHLTYADGADHAPASLVVKVPSVHPESVDIAVRFGFYEREVAFYRSAAAALSGTVRCHHASIDDSGAEFVLVLDDASHCRAVDQLDGAGVDDARAVLETAADLHARFRGRDALAAQTWLPMADNPKYLGANEHFRSIRHEFDATYRERLSTNGRAVIDRLPDVSNDILIETCARSDVTIAHYDLRLDNVLFDDRDDRPRMYLLDWQLTAGLIGAFDVAYFLGWSLTADVRRTHFDALLRHYHERLGAKGVDDYPLAQLEDDVRQMMLFVGFMGAYASITVPPANERGQRLIDAMLERPFAAIDDLRSEEFLARR